MRAHPAPEYVGISVSAPLLIAPAELNSAITMATTHIYSVYTICIGQLVWQRQCHLGMGVDPKSWDAE